jgi:hypothetical protein
MQSVASLAFYKHFSHSIQQLWIIFSLLILNIQALPHTIKKEKTTMANEFLNLGARMNDIGLTYSKFSLLMLKLITLKVL